MLSDRGRKFRDGDVAAIDWNGARVRVVALLGWRSGIRRYRVEREDGGRQNVLERDLREAR